MRADRIWIAAATPICAGLLYFLLAGEVNTSETLAGAVVVVLGSSYAVALGVCPPPPNTNLFRGSLYTWNVAASGGANSDMA